MKFEEKITINAPASDVSLLKRGIKHGRCFPAGTLIHTDKGLLPIQNIKVGDRVVSRPELGGQNTTTEYKRITRAFCSGEDELVRLCCQKDSEYDDYDAPIYFEFMTPNHLIWDNQLNVWIPASKIEIGTLLSSIDNKDNLRVLWVDTVWDSFTDKVGLTYPIFGDYHDDIDMKYRFGDDGFKVIDKDYNNGFDVSENHIEQLDREKNKIIFDKYQECLDNQDNRAIRVPVFNLEVEDNHTFFIGKHSIWVKE